MNRLSVIRAVLPWVLYVLLGSCSSPKYSSFTIVDNHHTLQGKTLAVISGLNTDRNKHVAACIENALRKESVFHIIPQKEVARLLPHYPINIQGPYTSAYINIETDYKRTDINKITTIHRKLRVDYIYVVWAPTASAVTSPLLRKNTVVYIETVGQLFSFPEAREVGHGKFVSSTGTSPGCFAPAPEHTDREKSLTDTCNVVAKEIARKTGMQKRLTR